jgi:hypothetical protein
VRKIVMRIIDSELNEHMVYPVIEKMLLTNTEK